MTATECAAKQVAVSALGAASTEEVAELTGRIVGTLVDGIVHDVNNPLTTVLANLEIVTARLGRGMSLAPDDIAALDESREAAARIVALLRDVRVFSRGNDVASVDLLVDSAMRATRQGIRARGIQVQVKDECPGVRVRGDERSAVLALTLLVDAVALRAAGDKPALLVSARVDGADVVLSATTPCASGPPDGTQIGVLRHLTSGFGVVDVDERGVALRMKSVVREGA